MAAVQAMPDCILAFLGPTLVPLAALLYDWLLCSVIEACLPIALFVAHQHHVQCSDNLAGDLKNSIAHHQVLSVSYGAH